MIATVADWVREHNSVILAAAILVCLLMIAVQYWTRPKRRPHRPGRHRQPDDTPSGRP